MASLLVTAGAKRSMAFKLVSGRLVAGREANRDIQILDPKVSRRHFAISAVGDGYVIESLGAKNGLYVNGRRVTEAKLSDGDRIVVGQTQLTFVTHDEPGQADAFRQPRQFSPAARAGTVRD